MVDEAERKEQDEKEAQSSPTAMHRASVFGDGLWKGEKFVMKTPAYLLDALNDLPMILNILPGVKDVGPFVGNSTSLYADYADEKLEAVRGAYNDTVGYKEQKKVDATDHILNFAGEAVGGGVTGSAGVAVTKKILGQTVESAVVTSTTSTAQKGASAGIEADASKSFGGKVWDTAKSLFDRVNPRSVLKRDRLDLGDKIVLLKDNPGPLKRLLAEARAQGFDSDAVDKINRLAKEGKIPQKIANEVSEQFTKRYQGTGIKGAVDSWAEAGKASAGVLTADPLSAAWLGVKGAVKAGWETVKLSAKTVGFVGKHPFYTTALVAGANKATDGESSEILSKGIKNVGGTVVEAAPVALEAAGAGLQKVGEIASSETAKELAKDAFLLAKDARQGTIEITKDGVGVVMEELPKVGRIFQKNIDPEGKIIAVAKEFEDTTGINPTVVSSTVRKGKLAAKALGLEFGTNASASSTTSETESPIPQPEANKDWSGKLLSKVFGMATNDDGALDTIKTKLKNKFNAFSDNPLGKMMNDMGAGQLTFAVAATSAIWKTTNNPLLALFGFLAALMAFGDDPAPAKPAPKPELAMG